jgi:mannobiose 2-epimerase
LREAALHGFRYLKEQMWDHQMGGWYQLLDRAGMPLQGLTKHGHGSSYAISACLACYQLTRDSDCLELAKSAFAWLEEHAHDGDHGGYFGFYRRDGGPAPGEREDAIGTPIGFKDANTTCDLLKAFADLHRVWPDVRLSTRLEELLRIARDRLAVAPGVMHMYAHPDWRPVPDVARYAQILRAANHMLPASQALGGAIDPLTKQVAKSILDTMLRVAWDSDKGGFYLAGSSFGPAYVEDTVVFVRRKCWWAQAEGMRLLLAIARLYPADAAGYEAHFVRLWDYVKRNVIDARRGGWLVAGVDTNPEARKEPKATRWKDCSHEAEGLLDSLDALDSGHSG